MAKIWSWHAKITSDATRYHNGHDLARPRYLGRTDHIRHHAVQNAHPSSWWTNHVAAGGAQDIPGLPVGCVLKSPHGEGGVDTLRPHSTCYQRVLYKCCDHQADGITIAQRRTLLLLRCKCGQNATKFSLSIGLIAIPTARYCDGLFMWVCLW